jgi:sialic acid synthase SpsE
MVDAIRGKVNQIGHAPTPEEKDMLLRHNRRLIAINPIKKGEFFVDGKNFGAYRSLKDDTHGLSGFESGFVNGKEAAKDMAVGDTIGPGDFV